MTHSYDMNHLKPLKALAAALVLLATVSPAFSAVLDDGVSVLKIAVSAEAASLGGVHPMLEGPDAIFFNPSGLQHVNQNAVSMTHAAMYRDTNVDAVAGAFRLGRSWGVLGVSMLALTHKPITARDDNGNKDGSFSAHDTVVGRSWAGGIGRHRLGIGYKNIRQSLAGASATGHAADVGYQHQLPGALLGLAVQNLGSAMKLDEESYALPLTLSVGLRYNLGNILYLNASAAHRPNAPRTTAGLGAEVMLGQSISLRAGYLAPLRAASAEAAVGFMSNLGFGVGWKFLAKRLKVDYSMIPGDKHLGMTHRFTMQLGWGQRGDRSRQSWDSDLDSSEYYTPYFQS